MTDTEKDDDFQVKLYMEKIKRYLNREDKVKTSLNKLFNVIWGHCSDQLQSSIKYLDDYEAKEDAKSIVWLLKELLRETAGIDSLGNPYLNLV